MIFFDLIFPTLSAYVCPPAIFLLTPRAFALERGLRPFLFLFVLRHPKTLEIISDIFPDLLSVGRRCPVKFDTEDAKGLLIILARVLPLPLAVCLFFSIATWTSIADAAGIEHRLPRHRLGA